MAHGYYQIPGGEDESFETRRDLLRSRGHRVTEYVRRNDEIAHYSPLRKLTLAARTTWAWDSNRELARILSDARPDVAHFGNVFPLMSPSIYYVCRKAGVPVVQNLENPRLMCPGGTFLREGKPCHDCVGRFPLPAVVHSCYRQSAAQTAVVAGMLGVHRALGTWHKKVDAYCVSTEFYRKKFVEFGLAPEKLHLCRLAVPDPGVTRRGSGDYALYVGRLGPEKGIHSLLEAWRGLDIPLKVRGSGPMETEVRAAIAANPRIELVPRLSLEQKHVLFRGARFLVWPSLGEYETFGLVVAEAYAAGIPVIASRTGVATEMIQEGSTGLFFEADNGADLAKVAKSAWEMQEPLVQMGLNSRKLYESRFTFDHAYTALISAYESAMGRRDRSARLAANVG